MIICTVHLHSFFMMLISIGINKLIKIVIELLNPPQVVIFHWLYKYSKDQITLYSMKILVLLVKTH